MSDATCLVLKEALDAVVDDVPEAVLGPGPDEGVELVARTGCAATVAMPKHLIIAR